jgi:hypothetical protein
MDSGAGLGLLLQLIQGLRHCNWAFNRTNFTTMFSPELRVFAPSTPEAHQVLLLHHLVERRAQANKG